MLIVVVYDISTENKAGEARLRRVSKLCENVGRRVQDSVFECKLDYSQYMALKDNLLQCIDEQEDKLRFYLLGNNYSNRIEAVGKDSIPEEEKIYIV